ncbi:3-methyl-2-oxobutanoate hydroxymethyltransferase [Nitrolancea hollandica]|uniref:3-methyl-2-oxobutanoate hydroxymethyltransferase n=1 Tax=Nitrolancea hollandica Lb TaxID=1129897 RepID=I4EHL1_9BACT|nr:3-methyl-2-oxobutanoate hydroxymethyltransferase [Nitrolancea hollandica]CCF84173.1 ketopantoate hydroxymethyltransferase [Nitrolancea hollandica Lb]
MRVSIHDLKKMKQRGERIAMLTAYDYPTARLLDEAGIPALLVGDTLGMVMLGHETTLPVTLDIMIHHTKAVIRGARQALVVADLPFLTYQVSADEAVRNAGRLLQEGGAHAVKLEGGAPVVETVARLVGVGIPVMAHLGLTPQSVHQLGGYRVQGKTPGAIQRLLDDARALESAGAFAVVLECVPAAVARLVTETLEIPTIGIGAGAGCDGQVQVITDLLHLLPGPLPRHAKPYLEAGELIREAVGNYLADVQSGAFPTDEQSFRLPKSVDGEVLALLGQPVAGDR